MDEITTAQAGSVVSMNATQVLRRYFFDEKTPAIAILTELKALTPADKAELAVGAAKELGVELI